MNANVVVITVVGRFNRIVLVVQMMSVKMNLTDELLILLIDVVIKTHDYENLNPYKERLERIKHRYDRY